MLDARPRPRLSALLTFPRRATALRIALVVFIYVLGATFRFADLGQARFSYDQAYPMFDALRLLDGHERLLIGQPSSVFLDNPPLMSYLQAGPLAVWRSPWAVYLAIAALNTLAIGLVYRAGRELLGEAAGFLAAFLFAISPWLVTFSRTTWVQSLIPFFTAVIAWGLWPVLATGRTSPRRVLIAFVATAAMTLTYIQSWGLLAQIGLLVLLFRKKIPRKPLVAGLLALVIAFALYGIGLANDWEANRAKLAGFFSGKELHLTSEGIEHAARLVTGQDFEAAQVQSESDGDGPRRTAASAVAGVLDVALVAGALFAMRAIRRRDSDQDTAVVLLVWFGVPILLTSVASQPVHPHYLLLSCPAGYLLAAWGLSPLLRHMRARWVAFPLLLSTAIVFGVSLNAVNQAAARQPTRPNFDGWTLESAAQVGGVVNDLIEGDAYPIRLIADGHSVLLSGLSGRYVRSLSGVHFPDFVLLPGAEPLLYVLNNVEPGPDVLGPHQRSFPERALRFADGMRVAFAKVSAYSRDEARALPATSLDWPSQAGLSLLGYTLTGAFQSGQTLECVTYWRVDELRPGHEEWYVGAFYHLLDAGGQTVVNPEGHAQWSRRWQVGDVYVERISLPLPADLAAGEYTLQVGLFDSVHSQNYFLESPGGEVPGVEIPVRIEP